MHASMHYVLHVHDTHSRGIPSDVATPFTRASTFFVSMLAIRYRPRPMEQTIRYGPTHLESNFPPFLFFLVKSFSLQQLQP